MLRRARSARCTFERIVGLRHRQPATDFLLEGAITRVPPVAARAVFAVDGEYGCAHRPDSHAQSVPWRACAGRAVLRLVASGLAGPVREQHSVKCGGYEVESRQLRKARLFDKGFPGLVAG